MPSVIEALREEAQVVPNYAAERAAHAATQVRETDEEIRKRVIREPEECYEAGFEKRPRPPVAPASLPPNSVVGGRTI